VIDLECAQLPDHILCDDGEAVEVVTDFRVWLRFRRLLSEQGVLDPSVLMERPRGGASWREGALEFLASPVSTPTREGDQRRLTDVLEDGDYIVGAFQQAYGIDLCSCTMHWHRFLALLRSLPSETKYAQIVGWRSWDASKARRSPEEQARELRRAWALPELSDAERDELVAWQQAAFGGE